MHEKGFATIFGLCLILVIALTVKGIQEAEANHARQVVNFQTEQALQNAAEGAIVEVANSLAEGEPSTKAKVLDTTRTFKRGEQSFTITVEVWGERGKIYHCDEGGNVKEYSTGVYLMSLATVGSDFFDEKIYRRAYAYVLDGDATIYFMELPTGDTNIVYR